MKAFTNILASGAAIAALTAAAPAAAQYYPSQGYGGYNQGYGNTNVVGQILNSILGGRTYAQNDRYAIEMCVRATEARLNGNQGGYGSYGYGNQGGYGSYGYGNQGYNQGYYQGNNGSRVTRITNVQRRNNGVKIFGLASAGYNQPFGGGYGQPYGGAYNQSHRYQGTQMRFNCKVNFRGQVTDVDIDRRRSGYGYNRY